jgi:transketolase
MRKAFFANLMENARQDSSIWLLCGDLGFSVLEPFKAAFPDRFINVGIAEQNMIGVAAGLALSGAKVFVYSIGNFATLRCYEQIRNDVCLHRANVNIVATGGGLAYGPQGYTHHIVEDIAAMRALPAMKVFCPGDPHEAAWATQNAIELEGPAYIRLARANEPTLHAAPLGDHPYDRAIRLRMGKDVALCATGTMLESALQTSDLLKQEGIEASVLSFPCVKPFDEASLLAEASKVSLIVTMEEHGFQGGFGERAAAALAENGSRALLQRFAIDESVIDAPAGSQAFLRENFGLTPDLMAARIRIRLRAEN